MSVVAWAQRGIARYEPPDRPDLEAFQRGTFGEGALQLDHAHFHWAFEEVPSPDPEGVQFWLCKRNGAVVGQQAGIPFRLKVGERACRASWAIDLMVAPEWRLRGVGPALSETHSLSGEVAVGVGISDAAYKAYKRGGWLDLGGLATFVRLIDLAACVRASQHGGPLARVLAAAGAPVAAVAAAGFAGLARLRGARLQEVPAFDGRVDALWAAVAPHHAVIAERDRRFLSWRFDRCPAAGRFRRLYVLRGGELMGYVVLRADHWKGASVGVVLDYLARPGWEAAAFALAVSFARRERLAALLCRTLNATLDRPLRRMGFLCLRNGLHAPTRIMARPAPGAEDLAGMLSNPRNWFVTAADSDLSFKELGA
ncbi:GNAT family N-acetyltransferase [Azospirillum sp. TSO22-1]|uniref:GNAT family N-acetyltransferase n=1 Tax=Azospirillum sp. TSO22-1 TaxID=716789 RepID=UPI000D619DF0|nr:GNAT family N-acetyltransferase [Azospirillum sp. TSO22-1]PWC34822.1 hypothetical protein TSO221_30970 [Azospirillum sp. TSO22-1]